MPVWIGKVLRRSNRPSILAYGSRWRSLVQRAACWGGAKPKSSSTTRQQPPSQSEYRKSVMAELAKDGQVDDILPYPISPTPLNSNTLIILVGSFGEFLIINANYRNSSATKWKYSKRKCATKNGSCWISGSIIGPRQEVNSRMDAGTRQKGPRIQKIPNRVPP